MILVTGGSGCLGTALKPLLPSAWFPTRQELDLRKPWIKSEITAAILAAGTKGFAPCEGNAEAFRADVDGNVWLCKAILSKGGYILFISTDAVEQAAGAAYARNRLLVEQALWFRPRCAVLRPAKFGPAEAPELAKDCIHILSHHLEGVFSWKPQS